MCEKHEWNCEKQSQTQSTGYTFSSSVFPRLSRFFTWLFIVKVQAFQLARPKKEKKCVQHTKITRRMKVKAEKEVGSEKNRI